MKRVVITGIGVISPIGCGKENFTNALKAGRSGIKHIPELQTLNFSCQVGGIPDYCNSSFLEILSRYNLSDASTTIIYGCLAGIEAWLDAGLYIPDFITSSPDPDTGISIGSGIGSLDIMTNKIIPLVNEGKHKKIRSSNIEQLLFNATGAFLSGILGTGNIATSNSNACATGTEAIINGFNHIRHGKAKRIIAGSTEGYSPYYWATFDALRVTATQFNDTPEKASRPMSTTACGMVPAAGAGILILEELETAIKRNAAIYAEIAGGFLNCGSQRNGGSMTAPNPDGVKKCITEALSDANVFPEQIDSISGHLTSTMADVLEVQNWAEILKRNKNDFPYINSLKSMTGHCLGAAGAIEIIASALEIKHQFIYPSINCENIHPEILKFIEPSKIPQQLKDKTTINYLAKTSFGFGDSNACIILKKFNT